MYYISSFIGLASCLMFQFLDLLVVMSYSAVASDFSRRLKPNTEQKENFLWQEFSFFFEDFSSLISRYFYQLVACARYAVERFFFLAFDGFPQVFLCSDGLKSVKILLFLLCLAFDFFRSEFLSGFPDIALCDIIKKSELWFIEWNMQRFPSPHAPLSSGWKLSSARDWKSPNQHKAKWKKMGNK